MKSQQAEQSPNNELALIPFGKSAGFISNSFSGKPVSM